MYFIEYRDPIFGIIIFLLMVAIISVSSYLWGIFKNKNEKEAIKSFIQSFENSKTKKEFVKILEDLPFSLESMTLLALNYCKSGIFDKAISIYLHTLENAKDKDQKIYIMTLLGKTYFLAGFLQRSKNVFLDIVKIQPRNVEVLSYLTLVFDKLHDFDSALESLEALFELGDDVKQRQTLMRIKKIVLNEQKLKKSEVLSKLKNYTDTKIGQRYYIEYIIKNDMILEYKDLKNFDFEMLVDLFWYIEFSKVPKLLIEKSKILSTIYCAKGDMDTLSQSEIFEYDVLIKLKNIKDDIDIGFKYSCQKCKNSFPIHFFHCSKCYQYDLPKITPIIIKKELKNEFSI